MNPEELAELDASKLTALADIATLAAELGQSPEQLKSNLEASRKWEQRAKDSPKPEELAELRKAQADLKALQTSGQTDAEKTNERITAAEKAANDALARLQDSETRALRAEVAGAKGVPVSFLRGDTKDALEAEAAELLKFKGTKPLPDLGQGAQGDDITGSKGQLSEADVDKLYADKKYDEIEAARAAGRLTKLLSGK